MAAKGTMKISVIGDASKFDRAMNNVQSKLSKVGSAVAKFGKVAAAGIAGAGAAAVAGAFKMADYANEVDRAARESGMAAEKIQVTSQAMERLGVDRERAVDGMRELNLRLGEAATEGGDAAEGFKSLGVKLRDAEGNIRSSGAVMDEVMAKLGNMPNQADRAAAAAKIFGDEAGFAFAGVAAEGDKLEQNMNDIRGSSSVMSEDAIDSAQQFEKSFTKMKNAALSTLTDALTPLVTWLGSTAMPFLAERVIPAIQRFGEWLGPRLSAAGEIAQRFFTKKLLPAFQRLSSWWDANGPTIISTAQTVGRTIVGFARSSHRHVTAFAGAVSSAISTVIGWFQSSGSQASQTSSRMQAVFGQLLSTTRSVWNAISTVIGAVVEQVATVVRVTVAVIQAVWERWGTDIKAFARTAFNAILNIIDGVLQTISGVFDVFAGLFTGDWERVWNGVKSIFAGILNIIEGLWETALGAVELALTMFRDTVQEVWERLWTWVKNTAQELWTDFTDWLGDRFDDLLGWFEDLPGDIVDAIGDLGSTLIQAGRDLIEGLAEGISGAGDLVVDAVTDAFSEAWEKTKGIFGGGSGDGPGLQIPTLAGGGSAMQLAQRVMDAVPGRQYITSAYRTPAENERVGGSPTSYHLDKTNPAVDIGGENLDMVFAALKQMGVPRELLGPPNAADHQDHVHVAHQGGEVTRRGIKPIKPDEVMAKLEAGETVRTREQEAALHQGGAVRGGDRQPIVIQIDSREVARATIEPIRDQAARLDRQGEWIN